MIGLALGLALFLAGAPAQAETAAQQVAIEPKLVEVSDTNAKDLGVSYLIYQNLEGRDAKGEFAFVVTPQPENKTKIEVTSLVYGQGAEFRRWVPKNPQLTVQPEAGANGNVMMKLLPVSTEKIYVTKPSAAAPIAPILFGILGSQYEGPGASAAASPGKVCPVTGQPVSGGEGERGDTAKAIDKAGMAAGMALLTSQAKGQLEGQKIVFLSDLPITGFLFKTEAANKDKNNLIILTTPKIININDNE